MYSKEGYRRNSPDKNNPYNIIQSGNISMKGVDFPVLGVDEYGIMQLMMPEKDYQFPGNTVLEIPYMQQGGIHINPANKGKFTAQANRANMGVQEYANYVLRNKEDFSSTTVKRANFARNANKWKKQEGGEMNKEIIIKIQEALQQGVTPEQLVKELQKQGITEQEAIQLVSAAMPQQEEMQQYQYGTMVRHNYADNINFDNKFNATALGLNAVSDPRNMTWALPDTGFGSGLKAISGLASGLSGSYLGYAKLFSNDKVTNNTPTATIGKNPNAQIQAPYVGTENEKALPTPRGKEQTLPDWLNPYDGNSNIQGTNQYSTFQKGGMKKYQWAGQTAPEIEIPNIPYNDFLNPTPAARPQQPYNYTVPGEMSKSSGQPVYNQSYNNQTGTYNYNEDYGRYKQYLDNFAKQDFSQTSKEEQNKPKDNSTITSMNDDALGFMIANNALIGFQNFNDVLSARDYEKEYNQMLMRTGNSDQRYNPINPTNPYGMYTPNAGIGSNYGLVANSHIQDFGTSMASAKCGGMKKKYKEGGEYNLTQEEIDYILKNGGEIEMLD